MKTDNKSQLSFVIRFILCLGFGITLIVFPGKTIDTMCYIIGIAAITLGLIAVIMYFAKKEQFLPALTLVLGIISITCGIILCIHPEFVKRIIPSIMGLFIIIDSALKIASSVSIKGKSLYWAGSFTLAIVGIVLGILIMVFGDTVANLIAVLAGVALIIDAVVNFILYLAYKKHIKSDDVVVHEADYTVKSSEVHNNTDNS